MTISGLYWNIKGFNVGPCIVSVSTWTPYSEYSENLALQHTCIWSSYKWHEFWKLVCMPLITVYINIVLYRKVVLDRSWTGSFPFYTRCKQTWAIENFYSHTLLNYCPKLVGYSFDSYVLRNQLAVLDHNHHVSRPVQETNDGDRYTLAQFSRKTKQWVAYERKCKKDYTYIPGMHLLTVLQRNSDLWIYNHYYVKKSVYPHFG